MKRRFTALAMSHMLSRRIAPVLILVQLAYVALLEAMFALAPDTAELDHTDPSSSGGILYAAVGVAVVLTWAGGAALLGLDEARTSTPRAVSIVWLAVLALGEVAVAVAFLAKTAGEAFRPDALKVIAATATCMSIALACATELRTLVRPSSAGAGI
ncbi:hypothetical protein ACFYP4_28950 [Streptomyces sp. NPDC005551]|uniref:hypothetical protein n=1 Tax=unclassified Streptomyces TaxID=2593676 RepID=UPI0034018655